MQINETQFQWLPTDQQIPRVQIVLHDARFMHSFDKAQDRRGVDTRCLFQWLAVESFGHQNAFAHTEPRRPFTQRQMPDRRHTTSIQFTG